MKLSQVFGDDLEVLPPVLLERFTSSYGTKNSVGVTRIKLKSQLSMTKKGGHGLFNVHCDKPSLDSLSK